MKICAVVCEFNPFHNGHGYVLQKARESSGCDAVLCVMSGNFVQRAEPSVANKVFRTRTALENGADFVVELPMMFAVMAGELFAYGAINIINQTKGVTHLAFGSECGDIEKLMNLARLQLSEEFNIRLKAMLSSGISYSSAMTALSGGDIRSNDILALEYIKQLIKTNSPITPVAIKRQKSNYNDTLLINQYSSASAIRGALFNENTDKALLQSNVPDFEKLLDHISKHKVNYELFKKLTVASIRNNENLSALVDAGEGLEIKLKKNALDHDDLGKICENTKSKRYSLSRIHRLALQSLFNITPSFLSKCVPVPIRVLGVKSEFKKHLSIFPKKNTIISTKDYDKLKKKHSDYLRTEKEAENIFSLLRSVPSRFYSYQLVVV